ncbi:MAG: phospholipid carrier-dependent glycosyltransferase, partial [Gammaproteobacteria bacterium]|nr:phospholipid carrier-dependent glycosyltransferase [Gammaproteobacteria bacterium]
MQYTSQIMLESLPGFTALITVLTFIRWRNQRHQVKSSYFWLIISSIALGLTASSKYIYVVVGF